MNRPIYIYTSIFFPSPNNWRGGYCFDAVRAIIRTNRYDVRIFVPGDGADYDYEGLHVCRVKQYGFPKGFDPFPFFWVNSRLFLKKIKSEGIDFEKIEVVHSNANAPWAAALKIANPNILAIYHNHQGGAPFGIGHPSLGPIPLYSDLLYFFTRMVYEKMDIMVQLNHQQKNDFGKAYPHGVLEPCVDIRRQLLFGRFYRPIRLKHPYCLYNGYDSAVFNVYGRKPHKGFVIGCIGNFIKSKDQKTLIRACVALRSKINDLKVKLIGSGPCLKDCAQLVKDNCLEGVVSFEAERDHLLLADWYRELDLFVLPSYYEGFCTVLIEAIACGTPAMATDAISFKEVIPQEDWDLWLFPVGRHDVLAKKIERFYFKRERFRFNQDMNEDYLVGEFLKEIEKVKSEL